MNDLDLIAGLRADVAEPPSASLAAGRSRLTAAITAETKPATARPGRMSLKRPAIAICAAAAAAATAAAGVALTSGPAAVQAHQGTAGNARTVVTAAWTVREAGGTVTIYLRQYANPARLQQTLRADGINAIVRRVPVGMRTVTVPVRVPGSEKAPLRIPGATCRYAATNDAPPAVQRAAVTFGGQDLPARFIIHPHAMPPGSALLLPFLTGLRASAASGHGRIKPQRPVVLNNDTVPACVPFTKPAPSAAARAPTAKQ
jgi:hypothetical protein